MFHSLSPTQINISINITYDPAPHFIDDLPSNLIYPIWSKSVILLPDVQDFDNDFDKVELLDSK